MVTLCACEEMGTGQEVLGKVESTWSWPRSNPALTTLLPLLAGGHFSLLAPLGEIQFARPSPLCPTQWDVHGCLQALAATRSAQAAGGGHTS